MNHNTGAKPSIKKHNTRGKTQAFHFGIWRRYQCVPFITKDSRSNKEKTKAVSDAFLTIICNLVARKIATFTEDYALKIWSKQKR
jgi:hypothetical protein